jgi:hypothetical protein
VTRDVSAMDYDELLLLTEVHRITSEAIKLAGSVPAVGSTDWWSAPHTAKVTSLLVLAEARLIDDPHALAAEQLREVSLAISGALDWGNLANHHVPHTELQRRRGELGPLCQHYTGGPVEWQNSGQETAA